MKKAILSITILLTAVFSFAFLGQAGAEFDPLADTCNGVPASGDNASTVCAERTNQANPLTGDDGLLIRAGRFISLLIGISSVIIIVFGSIKFITSNGEPAAIDSAKKTIVYALIGLVIALLAQGIIIFVVNKIE